MGIFKQQYKKFKEDNCVWFKRNTYDASLILDKFPDINKNWLLTGEGKMLKTPPPSIPKDKVHTTLSTHDIDEQSKRELNPTIEELIDIITTNTKTIDRLTLIIETLSSKI